MNMQNITNIVMHILIFLLHTEPHAEAVYTLLTFHAELGAPAIFVNEDKHDEEEDAGKASQAHCDWHLET